MAPSGVTPLTPNPQPQEQQHFYLDLIFLE